MCRRLPHLAARSLTWERAGAGPAAAPSPSRACRSYRSSSRREASTFWITLLRSSKSRRQSLQYLCASYRQTDRRKSVSRQRLCSSIDSMAQVSSTWTDHPLFARAWFTRDNPLFAGGGGNPPLPDFLDS